MASPLRKSKNAKSRNRKNRNRVAPGGGEPPRRRTPRHRRPARGAAYPPAPRCPRANDNSPRVAGSAPGADTVKIFANAKCCRRRPVAKGSAGDLGNGLTVHVADNSDDQLHRGLGRRRQRIGLLERRSPTSRTRPAPRTKITMGPGVKTRHRKAVFRFADIADDPPGTTFLCKLDRKKWRQCSSPYKLRHLGRRRHVLRVRGNRHRRQRRGQGRQAHVQGRSPAVGARRSVAGGGRRLG